MTNQYITGAMIKRLLEEKKLTQSELADKIFVTDKAISKWETGRGYPDISFIAAVRSDGVEIKKLYPEQNAEARFKSSGTKQILFYCNQHGLYKVQPGRN